MSPTSERRVASQVEPLYRQLAERLRLALRTGEYPVGSVLPPVQSLAERYGVSAQTARGALGLLRSAGLVSSRRRGGTRVEAAHVDRSGHLMRALDRIVAYGDRVQLKVTGKESIVARTDVAEILQCSPGQPWFKITGYRYLRDDPRPRVYVEVYLNHAYARVFERVNSRTRSIFSLFEELYGEAFVEFRQEIRSVSLSSAASTALGAEARTMGLRYVNRFLGEFGDTLQVSVNTHMLNDVDAFLLHRGAVAPEM